MTRAAALLTPIVMSLGTSPPASASTTLQELPSVMVVSKSSNRNEVHYAVSVDQSCAPVASAPVRPYWRMNEKGAGKTEGLTGRENAVLGVARQQGATDGIEFAVRGMPGRTFVVHTGKASDGSCTSYVDTTISGARARLLRIYVKQKLFGVDYVLITGRTADGRTVDERVKP